MEDRWFWVDEHLQGNLAVVFLGNKHAAEAMEIPWPESCVHHSPEKTSTIGGVILAETTKLYLPWGKANFLTGGCIISLRRLDIECAERGIAPAWFEWQFMRVDARMACCRASEGVIWGFGRPHPTKPTFRVHQDFAGPLRDYRPGMADIPVRWKGFEPVFMKVETDGEPKNVYHIKIHPEWLDEEVVLIVNEDPEDVPEVLREYQFGKKAKKVQTRF